jgi:hypothetical protein
MGTKNKKKEPKILSTYKWNFAIGTTSRVPGRKRLHYLILDIDGTKDIAGICSCLTRLGHKWRSQKTENGYHVYTNFISGLKECAIIAGSLGADRNWIRIAEARGYFFLADKRHMQLDWPVERMIIYRGKKEAQNTRAS